MREAIARVRKQSKIGGWGRTVLRDGNTGFCTSFFPQAVP